jgi:hypothetical protein
MVPQKYSNAPIATKAEVTKGALSLGQTKYDWSRSVRNRISVSWCSRGVSACVKADQSHPKEATMSKAYSRLDKNNAAVLLVDHQAGLLSLVRDIEPDKFKNNVLALADLAAYFKLPTILTTSFEDGPNGPLD